ncbi:MAG: phage integrase SAM-like domain-containing protein [Gudongella sp.]|jgi:site-specific recombinase XerD|nr:phage integrase SAM-like domain-containing protein [Gudongella sp.]
MATIRAFVRTASKKVDKANIRFRLRDGRKLQYFYKSEIEISTAFWDNKAQSIKAKVVYDQNERTSFNKSISDRKNIILQAYTTLIEKQAFASELMDIEIEKLLHPEKFPNLIEKPITLFDVFEEFLDNHKLSDVRKNNFRVIKRALQRYELYVAITSKKPFELKLSEFRVDTLRGFEEFLKQEHQIFTNFPEIYNILPESRTPQPRGQNTINDIFTKLRTFFLWSVKTKKTENNPFKYFTVEECVYGTPYYITIDERNKLYKTDLSKRPLLAIQRDIFVFHCLIGCRIGDLYKMTKGNVINGAIEYIPRKTKEGRPITVRVPLNTIANEIMNRYKVANEERLFPFISEQKYNIAIKEMFEIAGLTRMVTIIDPTTREELKRPLNEIASSHLARRCFVGNLYKQVKDPNLVGALSGHKEGSKAFARYREIDDEIKNELVKMLE